MLHEIEIGSIRDKYTLSVNCPDDITKEQISVLVHVGCEALQSWWHDEYDNFKKRMYDIRLYSSYFKTDFDKVFKKTFATYVI